jgi:hypothetical protein
MHKILPILMLTIAGFTIPVLFPVSPLIAHTRQNTADVGVMIHLDPKDSPYAGRPTLTWFMLTRKNGEMISPASCNCRVAAYNSRNQAIATQLPLSAKPMPGHSKEHQVIQTTITFPQPGAYKVLLTGRSKDASFAPFEFQFPVIVRP